MKSNSGYERTQLSIGSSKERFSPVIALFLVITVLCPLPAFGGGSLSGIARLSTVERLDRQQIQVCFDGLSSLGLRREAAEFLEKRILLGEITRDEAAVLFEETLVGRYRTADPETLLRVCETAFRAGIRTPMILYAYGTALRLAGRPSDGAAVLAQVEAHSPLYPYAIYGIGQIAAERGEDKGVPEVFRRVREMSGKLPGGDFLARRAMRSEAEWLLTTGRFGDSAKLFRALLDEGVDPYSGIGFSLAGNDNTSGTPPPPAEAIAGLSPKQRILFSLVQEGLSREQGRFEDAISYLDRADEEIAILVSSGHPPSVESSEWNDTQEILYRQIEAHRSLRQWLLSRAPGDEPAAVRAGIVELMAQLLILDYSIERAKRPMLPADPIPGIPAMSAGDIDEVLLWIERATLDGVDVDRLVEEQEKKLELLRNLAHPIQRYRLLTRLEKSQAEIHDKEARIRERREPIARMEEGDYPAASPLFTDLGRFLKELEALRLAAEETREHIRKDFDILRERKERKEAGGETIAGMVRDSLAFDNDRFVILSSAFRSLEDRARILSRERAKKEILDLRPVILRRLVDSLASQAYILAERQPPGWSGKYWAALERGASFLGGNQLSARDRTECAIRIGSVLAGGRHRKETFPGKTAGEKETRLSRVLLPILGEGAVRGERKEESHYVLAIVRMLLEDKDAAAAAGEFLVKYPASPFAGEIAVRLGNLSLLEGKEKEASSFFRKAAGGSNRDAAEIARYMLGWDRFRRGDVQGAIHELAGPLSAPSFTCKGDITSFEESVLALAVRAWMEIPTDRLDSYPPVAEGKCGGRHLLISLGEAEEKRGETIRAAKAYDAISARFAADRSAVLYETKAVEVMFRAGKENEAFSRAIRLKEKYGLDSPSESPLPPERKMARQEVAEMLASLAERKFEEGIRTGNPAAWSLSAAAMEQCVGLREAGSSDRDAELLLKWAIALIRSGDREEGVRLLLELLGEQRADPIGERAANLYAETMLGAYERNEGTAEEAEDSTFILLEDHPSEKAAALGIRAAAVFLRAGEYERSIRIAASIEENRPAPDALARRARLIQAEAFLFADKLAAARRKAGSIVEDPSKEVESPVRARAKDIFLVASLKEAEASMAAKDWKSGAGQWEELWKRFPDVPEAQTYALRAFRSYRSAGDAEGADRIGSLFLRKFPRSEDTVEIAGFLGPYLEERNENLKAADIYASVAAFFPRNERSPRFLFLAARLSAEHGDPGTARKRFASYRAKYSNPRWATAYATLAGGLLEWKSGATQGAFQEMEEGLRRIRAGVEPGAPGELNELAGRARIAIGEYWSDRFRKRKLIAPLEKSLAAKDRFYRRALAAFDETEEEAPLELAVTASLLSGDLMVEFGKSIISSEVPKGMNREEREKYEEALGLRARTFFERAMDRYSGGLDRLEEEEVSSDLAVAILERLEQTQRLIPDLPGEGEGG